MANETATVGSESKRRIGPGLDDSITLLSCAVRIECDGVVKYAKEADAAATVTDVVPTLTHHIYNVYWLTFTPDAEGEWTYYLDSGVTGLLVYGTVDVETSTETPEIPEDYDAALAIVERYCDRVFALTEWSVKVDGNGTDTILLPQWPITEVSSVEIDDEAVTDYEQDGDSRLYREDGWPAGRKNIAVEFTAGYASLPDDLAYVVNAVAEDIDAQTAHDASISAERLGDYSYTLASTDKLRWGMLLKYTSILDAYRRVTLA